MIQGSRSMYSSESPIASIELEGLEATCRVRQNSWIVGSDDEQHRHRAPS